MEDKATFYAYLTIHDFFDCFVFDAVIRDTNTIIRLCAGNKIWKKEQPGDVVFHMEKLAELCSAAFVIHDGFSQREEVIINAPPGEPPDIYKTKWYFDGAFSTSLWDNIPRNLSAGQYYNPYKAIKKFCNYMPEAQWKKTLETLVMYALYSDSVLDISPHYNLFTMRLRLLQLIEACHLINVRTTNKEKKEDLQKTKNQKTPAKGKKIKK